MPIPANVDSPPPVFSAEYVMLAARCSAARAALDLFHSGMAQSRHEPDPALALHALFESCTDLFSAFSSAYASYFFSIRTHN